MSPLTQLPEGSVLVICCVKICDRRTFKIPISSQLEGLAHCGRKEVAEKAEKLQLWPWEQEAAGLTVPTAREQRRTLVLSLPPLFLQSGAHTQNGLLCPWTWGMHMHMIWKHTYRQLAHTRDVKKMKE